MLHYPDFPKVKHRKQLRQSAQGQPYFTWYIVINYSHLYYLINKGSAQNENFLLGTRSKVLNKESNCKSTNIGYKIPSITCQELEMKCKDKGRRTHQGAQKEEYCEPLYKHKLNKFQNEDPKFEIKVLRTFIDPLTRLANEGVRIRENKLGESLNSKSEFYQPATVRIQIEK